MKFSLSKLQQLQKKNNIDLIGVAKSSHLKEDENVFRNWLNSNYNGDMNWMENHIEKRTDPQLLFSNTKSVIVIGMNYFSNIQQEKSDNLLVSKYVTEIDYHKFLKQKLFLLLRGMQNIDNSIKGKVCVDTSPIFEKAWGIKAGLGWRGKNSLLISPEYGSWIFLGILLVNVEFDKYSKEKRDECEDCNLCVESCPTGAILKDNKIDANKCISYLTVGNNDKKLPTELQLNNWIYGCDICQDICPYNEKNKKLSVHLEFRPKIELHNKSKKYWENISESEYRKLKKKTAMKRRKFLFILRNINHNL